MNRTHFKVYAEYSLLLAALLTGSLLTSFTASDKNRDAVASTAEASAAEQSQASTENPLLDTIGFDVDVRHLIHIASVS